MFWSVEGKVSIAKTQLALHHFKEFFKYAIVDMNTVSWKKILFYGKHANLFKIEYSWIKIK